MRIIVSLILSLLVFILAGGAFMVMLSQRPQVQPQVIVDKPYNVDVFTVTPIDFTETLQAFGTARAEREVVIAAQVSGEIVEVHSALKIGRAVFAGHAESTADTPSHQVDGDLLLRIDDRDFNERVDQAMAVIASSQTEIEQLKQQQINLTSQKALAQQDMTTIREDFERVRNARQQGALSPADQTRAVLELRRYEDTLVQIENQASLIPHQIKAAQQRIATNQTDLQRAKNDLERTAVRPPFNSVISEVMIEQGQFVRAGEPLLRLIDPNRVEIPVSMAFEDYMLIDAAVRNGDFPIAWLAENESTDTRWTGYVVRVSPTADSASRTIEVFVEVNNQEQQQPLLPGTFVFARIKGPLRNATTLIPREAIVENHVFIVDEQNVVQKKSITTERHIQSLAIVGQELKTGDRILLTNLDIVREGIAVTPQKTTTVMDEITIHRNTVIRIETPPTNPQAPTAGESH